MKYLSIPFVILFAYFSNLQSEGTKIGEQVTNVINEDSQNGSGSIRISRDGVLIAEFPPYIPGAVRMSEDEGKESLLVFLHSEDNKYVLSATFPLVASGTYSIGKTGSSGVELELIIDVSGASPRDIILDKGNFKITLNGKTCSGNFSGTGKELNSNNYAITGTFTDIPIAKKDAKEKN